MFIPQGIFLFFLLEAFTLFAIAGRIGFFNTLLLQLAASTLGFILIQRQGFSMILSMQKAFDRTSVPVDKIFANLCMIGAGFLFILPGFIGDILAIFLMIPMFQTLFKARYYYADTTRTSTQPPQDGDIIEGSYVRVEETIEKIEQSADNKNNT